MCVKKIFSILFFLIFVQAGFSVYISEINFGDNEFVEIFSNESIDFDGNVFFDSGGIEKANILTKIRDVNSSFSLIVGDDFLENYDVSNSNCSIYKTGKSKIGYYGLKDSGEDFTIVINSSFNLSYSNLYDYDFDENESLHYDFNNSNFFKSDFSVCDFSIFEKIEKNYSINNLNYCDSHFEIKTDDYFFEDKIQFYFDTDLENFTINYWVENSLGEIVKNKINTTNKNKKSYTPKSSFTSDVYFLKANISWDNCSVFNFSKVGFISKSRGEDEKNVVLDDFLDGKSGTPYIKILNKDELKSGKTNFLEYEVYRGKSRKYSVNFKNNGFSFLNLKLDKYSKVFGKVEIEYVRGGNKITIEGMDNFIFYDFFNNKSDSFLKDEKLYFKNIYQNFDKITVDLVNNYEIRDFSCYLVCGKTKISEVKNFTKYRGEFSFDLTVLDDFKNDVKLICKNKNPDSNAFNYLSKIVDFKKSKYFESMEINNSLNYKEELLTNNNNVNNSYLSIEKDVENNKNELILAKNVKIKNKTVLFFMIPVILLLVFFIIKW